MENSSEVQQCDVQNWRTGQLTLKASMLYRKTMSNSGQNKVHFHVNTLTFAIPLHFSLSTLNGLLLNMTQTSVVHWHSERLCYSNFTAKSTYNKIESELDSFTSLVALITLTHS